VLYVKWAVSIQKANGERAYMESTVVIVIVNILLVDSSSDALYGVTPFKQAQTVYTKKLDS
jgi:hypothetical protein